MLSTNETPDQKVENTTVPQNNYYNKFDKTPHIESVSANQLNNLLEKEKQKQKSEPWNKIDKTTKIQILHSFAEKYGNENNIPIKEIKNLKTYFVECLNKDKLQKNKDVVYSRDLQQITSIPALHFNSEKKSFTLRIMDNKRVSTLKSLTPKKNKI